MTAVSAARRIPRPGSSWQSMLWVVWRQRRPGILGLLALWAAIAGFIVVTGLKFRKTYSYLAENHCQANANSHTCAQAASELFLHSAQLSIVNGLVYILPLAAGLFIGAPLLASELETGTYRFTWTQGAGSRTWLWATMLYTAVPLIVMACGMALLDAWFAQPFEYLGIVSSWQAGLFEAGLITFAGSIVLAFMIGILSGALVGKVVPSLAVTAVALGAVAGAVYWKLSGMVAGLMATTAHGSPQRLGLAFGSARPARGPGGIWVISQWLQSANGKKIGLSDTLSALRYPGTSVFANWMSAHHLTLWWRYQPSSRLWLLQSAEGAALVAVSAVIGLMAIVFVRRRSS